MKGIYVKRIYEQAEASDGYRILVDRLWPRGVSKERAQLSEWLKELAPSTELRKWFNHEETKFEEFLLKYTQEITQTNMQELFRIKRLSQTQRVCLLYAAKDETRNPATILKSLLDDLNPPNNLTTKTQTKA